MVCHNSSNQVSVSLSVICVQRLCEEMEYSELLDRLPSVADPHERMVLLVCLFLVYNFTL